MPPSIPLAHYLTHPGCGVLVICLTCKQQRDFDLEAVIARLEARGLDALNMGIKDVADHVREPCPKCGGRRFETRPAFTRIGEGPGRPPYGGF